MFACVKRPKNLCEYRLFRGAADFGNLQQWDLYETGYSFLTVVTVPNFLSVLASQGTDYVSKDLAAVLLNNFVYILEHEFRGLSGISGVTADGTSTITDGISELQMINKVTEDTSITVEMKFFEKSGAPITKLLELFLRGVKDTRTLGKHYWGLIENGILSAGFENEVFSFLYYITDNTYRNLERAVLLMCAQPTEAPTSELWDSEKGTITNPELSLRFNTFPVFGDDVQTEAARLLEYLLSEDAGKDRLIIDTQSAKDFYHIGGGNSIPDKIKTAYGLRMSNSTSDANGYTGGSDDNKFASSYSTYQSKVDAKQTSKIYS